MSVSAIIGDYILLRWAVMRDVSAMAASTIALSFQPSTWKRPVRVQFARQILFSGVEAIWIVALIAVLTGASVVVQAQLWLSRFGQTEMLGALLTAVIIRVAGPVLVNFVVIGRSGTAIATELANMRVRGEVSLLDAQGIDPMLYLILPRVLGLMISVLSLVIIFILLSLSSGYMFGLMFGVTTSDAISFANSVFSAITPGDVYNLLGKTLIPGIATGCICSFEGLRVRGLITEVPQATTKAVVNSILTLLLISVLVSVCAYV